ncbi:MAG TPA: dioxygenase [Dehalococcoidia bacterium]|nr:dioxygenase [Dehalococcoidia bacterium]
MVRTAAEDRLLSEVLRTFQNTPNPRLLEIVEAAVRHLHAFVDETKLTHDEWMMGIDFLTKVGKFSDPTRQEFILLSDVMGVSSRVETVSYAGAPGSTEATVLGPFYIPGSPKKQNGDSVIINDDGTPRLRVSGVVRSLDGTPIPGATVDVWQTATNAMYPVQDESQDPNNLRGYFTTDANGRYEFITTRPVAYPVPVDGPAGAFLKATGRHPMRAAHIHLIVAAPGCYPVTTHIFDAESDYLDSDAVFGVRDSLIKKFEKLPDGSYTVNFDITLTPSK